MEEGNRDGEQWKRRGGGRGFLGKLGKGRGEGAVVGRSPGQMQGIKSIRRRLNDDDLGDIFSNISSVMRNEIVSVVGNTPKEMQVVMKDGLEVMAKAVEEMMDRIAENDRRECSERKVKERKAEECMARIEEKVQIIEKRAEVALAKAKKGLEELDKKAEVGLTKVKELEERLGERLELVQGKVTVMEERAMEEKVKMEDKVKSVTAVVDMAVDEAVRSRVKESVKDMEGKVRAAMCGVKVGNINIGQVTENKVLIVRKVLGEVRKAAKREEEGQLDKILRRTRVVVLGKRTEERREGGKTIQSVPILLQCQERKDTHVLEGILKGAGYFPTLHWPDEVMEFIKGVREEVRRTGVSEMESWIRIRPVEEEGRIRIRVDTKPKTGGKFRLEGVWGCPPLEQAFWEEAEGLYTPLYVG